MKYKARLTIRKNNICLVANNIYTDELPEVKDWMKEKVHSIFGDDMDRIRRSESKEESTFDEDGLLLEHTETTRINTFAGDEYVVHLQEYTLAEES